MKKYKEGEDYEWVKTEGSNAKSRRFFTKKEKAARASAGSEKAASKSKTATTRKAAAKPAEASEGSLKYGPSTRGGKRRSSSASADKPKSKSIAKRMGLDRKPNQENTSLLRSNTPRRAKMVATDTTDDARAARGTGRLNMETRPTGGGFLSGRPKFANVSKQSNRKRLFD